MRYRILALLGSAILLLGGCGLTAAKPSTASIDDQQLQWSFTQADQHPEKQLIEVIQGAKRTLDIAIYSLTYPDIVAAIKEAKKRGVTVRLVTDKIQAQGKTQKEALKLLGSAGIPIKINSHSGLMHLKMTIADNEIATTGSFNYSKAASTTNDEMLLVLRDAKIAKSFEAEFERVWEDKQGYASLSVSIAQPEDNADLADEAAAPEEGAAEASPSPVSSCKTPTIKGNINAKGDKIYHVPGGQSYARTEAEEMFCSEADAAAAGFRKASK